MRALIAGLFLALIAGCAFAAQPVTINNAGNSDSVTVTNHKLDVNATASLSGSTSNASSGVATSSTNVPTVSYTYGFNGTTWDQLQVDGSKNLKVVLGGPLGTIAPAGAVAVALDSTSAAALQSIITNTGGAIPAGSALIGKVGIDQTTPGTTNNVTISTNVGTLPLIQATASAAVSTSSAATLQVVAASGSTVIRVTHWDLTTTLANNVTWESGDTGGSCANPVALTGAMPFAANGGVSAGSGLGAVLILPSGKALCMLTSAATQISGSVSYAQF